MNRRQTVRSAPLEATAPPAYLKVTPNGVLLSVKLQPRARRNEIVEVVGTELKVKVTAPPVDSAANEALVKYLADQLGFPRGTVQLVRGATSCHKSLLLATADWRRVEVRLRELQDRD